MSRAALLAFALGAAVVAVGCRAIVGIDDLTLVDAGAEGGAADGGGHDGTADGAPPADASVDTAADSTPPPCGNTTTRGACEMCCGSQDMTAFTAFQMFADQPSTCTCNACSGQCTSQIKVCGGPNTAMMTMCLGCMINSVIDDACTDISTKCQNDGACRPYLGCIATCKPLGP